MEQMNFRTTNVVLLKGYKSHGEYLRYNSIIFNNRITKSHIFGVITSGVFNPRQFNKIYFTKIELFFMWLFKIKAENLLNGCCTLSYNKLISSSWVSANHIRPSSFRNRFRYIDDTFFALNKCVCSKLWKSNI